VTSGVPHVTIRPAADLRSFLGRQRNPYTGVEYEVTLDHFVELEALEIERITRPERYFLLVRTGDEILDWRAAVSFYGGAYQYVAGGGTHGWEHNIPSAGHAPVAPRSSPTSWYTTPENIQHLAYVGVDQQIHELFFLIR